MQRLTTNKDISEMGMYEVAHNSCYIKDGCARYREIEMDVDARDVARNLMATLTGEHMSRYDDDFDEEILENLQYDPFGNIVGLIALFYRNLWAMADLREKLKEYEDLEESVFNMFNGQITVKKIIETFVAFHELHQQGTEVAECVLLVNDEVRQYHEWKLAAEQKGE